MDEATSTEVTQFLDRLAESLIVGSPDGIASSLAPWLGDSAASELWAEIQQATLEFDPDSVGAPDTSELYDNPMALDELREDADLPDELTDDNFAAWCCISIRADEGDTPLYDLWCALARREMGLCVAYYEVEEPD
jgi:hypothetical protein